MTIYTSSAASKMAGKILSRARGKLAPEQYIESQVYTMEIEDLRALAVTYLVERMKNQQRAHVLVIEKEATKRKPAATAEVTHKRVIVHYSDLDLGRHKPVPIREYPKRTPAQQAADKDRARELEIKQQQESEARWAAINKAFENSMNELKQTWFMEWTDELLESEFAVGDGTTVKWGDATVAQHRARMNMHENNARAAIEGAARHQQAIQLLDSTGATTLRSATSVLP